MGLKEIGKIPFGNYCYTLKDVKIESSGIKMITENCPYYEHKKDLFGYCSYLKEEIIDQVKACEENWEDI